MVLDSIFMVDNFVSEGNEVKASLRVNDAHHIFKGHFPGQPVVPGVCMMQSVKELVQRAVGKKLMIVEADNMKFLSVIDPRQNKDIEAAVNYSMKDATCVVNASLFAGNITFFKLKATLNTSN
jgi:3-hydroxyacyl-[acyl-carrier-protein] dehydratase